MRITDLLPTPMKEGPPLPRFLGVSWPGRSGATYGVLTVTCDPASAVVSIDGSTPYATPLNINLTSGPHTILAQAKGYEDYNAEVNVAGGKISTLKLTLMAAGSEGGGQVLDVYDSEGHLESHVVGLKK